MSGRCVPGANGDTTRGNSVTNRNTTRRIGGLAATAVCQQRTEKVKLVKEDGAWKITADK